jgi:hypothetical protein
MSRALAERATFSASAGSSASSSVTGSCAKKAAHASEQDRPDILKRRREWFYNQIHLYPARLVFIDEAWAKTKMPSPI